MERIKNRKTKPYHHTLLIILLLHGCAVGPNFHRPPPPPVCSYSNTPLPHHTASAPGQGGEEQFFNKCQDIPHAWWVLFHSPQLNELIREGLLNNPNVKKAQAALCEARENLYEKIGSKLMPSIDAQFFGQRIKTSLLASHVILPSTPQFPVKQSFIFNIFNASVGGTYHLDLFGGARREVEAFCSLQEYRYFELEATYLTLTANIVTTAITVASLRDQIDTTVKLMMEQMHQLSLSKRNLALGHISPLDLLILEEKIKNTQVTLLSLKKRLARTNHALAALVGRFPCENLPQLKLKDLHLPEDLPVSLPSLLVQQRPDIRSAEALLHKASAKVGVAKAKLYPDIIIDANYGWTSGALSSLFDPASRVWSYGGQILQPIFRGGALRAKHRAAIAAYDQALSQYRKTVLESFKDVANVLRALQYDAEILNVQTKTEFIQRSQLKIRQNQFNFGRINFLTLLNSKEQYYQIHLKRIQAEARRYSDTAALFQALGGGWWNTC